MTRSSSFTRAPVSRRVTGRVVSRPCPWKRERGERGPESCAELEMGARSFAKGGGEAARKTLLTDLDRPDRVVGRCHHAGGRFDAEGISSEDHVELASGGHAGGRVILRTDGAVDARRHADGEPVPLAFGRRRRCLNRERRSRWWWSRRVQRQRVHRQRDEDGGDPRAFGAVPRGVGVALHLSTGGDVERVAEVRDRKSDGNGSTFGRMWTKAGDSAAATASRVGQPLASPSDFGALLGALLGVGDTSRRTAPPASAGDARRIMVKNRGMFIWGSVAPHAIHTVDWRRVRRWPAACRYGIQDSIVTAKQIVARVRLLDVVATMLLGCVLAAPACARQADLGSIGDGPASVLWRGTFEPGDLFGVDRRRGRGLLQSKHAGKTVGDLGNGAQRSLRRAVHDRSDGGHDVDRLPVSQSAEPAPGILQRLVYVPSTTTVGLWLSLTHFSGSETGDGRNLAALWDVNLYPLSGGGLAAQLYDYAGTGFNLRQVTPVPFPLDTWVQLEVYLSKATGPTGEVTVWQDGVQNPSADQHCDRLQRLGAVGRRGGRGRQQSARVGLHG